MRLKIRIILIVVVGLVFVLRMSKRVGQRSTGFYVKLPTHIAARDCGDGKTIIVEISKEAVLQLNAKPISNAGLGIQLNEIYSVRAERVLFVAGDSDVSFQEVAETIDVARGAVQHLYLGLLTPASAKEPCLTVLAQQPN